jgi:Family of unknown function (DUF6350)
VRELAGNRGDAVDSADASVDAANDAESDRPRRVPEAVGRSLLLSALWTGAGTAVLGAVIGICVCVVSWLPNAGVSGHPLSAIRAGVFSFLVGQRGGSELDGTAVQLTPLGITLIVAVLAWRASTALGEAAVRLNRTRTRSLVGAWLMQTAGYTVAVIVLAGFGRIGTTRVDSGATAVAAALLFGVVAGAGLLRTGELRQRCARISPVLIDGLRAGVGAATIYLGAGALLVAASLVAHAGAVTHLSRLVGGGTAGEPILLLGIFTAPNAAIAGAAYLAGPGFALGSGTHVGAFGVSHGLLPAFPVLGAVPVGRGPHEALLIVMTLTAVLAGALVAKACAVEGLIAALRRLGVATLATFVIMAALAGLAGGSAGPGRLRVVGASPWQLGGAVALEAGAVALVLLGTWSLCRLILGRDAIGRDDSDAEELVEV